MIRRGSAIHTDPAGDAPRDRLATLVLDRLGDALDRLLQGRPAAIVLDGALATTALLALAPTRGSKTWSIAASGTSTEDLARIRQLAEASGAVHHEFEVNELALPDVFERAVTTLETVVWDTGDVARFLLLRELSFAGVTTLLSGIGAGEVFCEPSILQDPEGGPPPFLVRHARDHAVARLLLSDEWAAAAPDRPEPLALGPARAAALERAVPEQLAFACRPATPAGVELLPPYLSDEVIALAKGIPIDRLVADGVGMAPLRDALRGMVPDAVRSGAVQSPAPIRSLHEAAVRKRWYELYDSILRPSRVAPLGLLQVDRVRKLFRRYQKADLADPGLPVMDRVLKRLSSLVVLNEAWSRD